MKSIWTAALLALAFPSFTPALAETVENSSPAAPAYGAYFAWGKGMDGWGHCYEYTSHGDVLNDGQPVSNQYCPRPRFDWGKGLDGYTHCYEYGGRWVLNEGQPVNNGYCGG